MTKWIKRLLAAGAVTTVMVGLLVSPAAAASKGDLAAVREMTDKFHNFHKAERAGYVPTLGCFDLPGTGGMGQHLINGTLMDGVLNAIHPEALVYEVDGHDLRLVAVEYIVPYTFVPATAAPPRLYGQPFHHNDALSLWALHAWVWRHNPLGMFADFNPNVDPCPGHGESE